LRFGGDVIGVGSGTVARVVRGCNGSSVSTDSAIPSRSVKVLVESRLANSRGGALAAGLAAALALGCLLVTGT